MASPNNLSLSALNLDDENGAPAVVVVDALNFLSVFVPVEELAFGESFAPALFREAERRVAAVATAAAAANLKLIWVFDNGQATDEALDKWRERRFKEVLEGVRKMPCSAETALYALLEQAGFVVLYPAGIDGDDAVALLAWHLGGCALSRDRDLLRYEPELPRKRVFRGFGICSDTGKLLLELQKAPLPEGVTPRDLESLRIHLPRDTSDSGLRAAWGMLAPTLCVRALAGVSKRGNADCLTAECGNLNQHALGLIAAVYHALGVSSAGVAVTLPAAVRDADGDGKVTGAELVTTTVAPDPCVDKNLAASRPDMAREWLRMMTAWPADHTGDETTAERDAKTLMHAARAHAVCMLAAEIADAMLYATNAEWRLPDGSHPIPRDGKPYSSPQRILAMYNDLTHTDPRLNPDLFTYDWWAGFSDEAKVAYLELLVPDSAAPNHVVRSESPDAWCRVVRCHGLDFHGDRVCKAHGSGAGKCFPSAIAFAREKGKTPLCSACIEHITQRRRHSSSSRPSPRR